MTQRTLFEKFDAVQVDNTQQPAISPKDERFCKDVQKEFDLIMEQLTNYQDLFTSLHDQDRLSSALSILPDDLLFSPKGCLDLFCEKIKTAKEAFAETIISYFSDRYYIGKIDCTELVEKEEISYKDIAAEIVSLYGDLVPAGENRLKDDFISKFATRDGASLTGAKISIPNMFSYDHYYDGKVTLHYNSGTQLNVFTRAVSFFETGDITNVIDSIKRMLPSGTGNRYIDFSGVYELALDKTFGVKFFKNRRVDVIFNSKEYARRFFDLFDCSRLAIRRSY